MTQEKKLKDATLVPNQILRDKRLTKADKLVYIALLSYDWQIGGKRKNVVFPSITTLETVLEASRHSIEPVIKEVQKHSMILFGPEEAPDGLVLKVEELRQDRDASKERMWKLLGISIPVATAASYFIPILLKLIFGK